MSEMIWRHTKSGEIYAVKLDAGGRVVLANGPLHYSDLTAGAEALASNAYEPDLAEDIEATKDDYVLVEG